MAMIPSEIRVRGGALPEEPGVYLMLGAGGKLLYVGKAGNLKRRVSSYFLRAHDVRIEKMVREIRSIRYRKTANALEALMLESRLIKRHRPPYNVAEKDDKSFLDVLVTKEEYPRVLLVRGRDPMPGRRFGPFTSSSAIREALKILRRIFPWSTHEPSRLRKFARPCFEYEIGLCPGTCVGAADRRAYRKTIRRLVAVFEGRMNAAARGIEREMRAAGKALDFERAAKLKRQLFSLRHVRDIALLGDSEIAAGERGAGAFRIEGYDVSNISGTSAVGSMAVFTGGEPDKSEYRKFRIRTIAQSDDTGMMKEMLRRRFKNDWPLPNLVLVDGGRGQVNAARAALDEANLRIPVVGIAKGPERKRNDIIGKIPAGLTLRTLVRVRDEAHRFAIVYHKKLRGARFLGRA